MRKPGLLLLYSAQCAVLVTAAAHRTSPEETSLKVHPPTAMDGSSFRFVELRNESKSPDVISLLMALMGLLTKFLPSPKISASNELGPAGPSMVAPPSSGGFNQVVKNAIEQAEKSVKAQLLESHGQDEFDSSILAIAQERLKKLWYIGQCRRNYAGSMCPMAWAESKPGTGLCEPPAGYTGPCRASKFTGSTPAQMEDFAWRCEAEWPCLNAPVRNYRSACPISWTNPGGSLCIAPREYNGYCSPAMDFKDFTNSMKAIWAAQCNSEWPTVIAKARKAAGKGVLGLATGAPIPSAVAKGKGKVALNGPVSEMGEITKILS